MAKKKTRGERDKGLDKNQIARATTTAGDMEFASDLTDGNHMTKGKKAKNKRS